MQTGEFFFVETASMSLNFRRSFSPVSETLVCNIHHFESWDLFRLFNFKGRMRIDRSEYVACDCDALAQ